MNLHANNAKPKTSPPFRKISLPSPIEKNMHQAIFFGIYGLMKKYTLLTAFIFGAVFLFGYFSRGDYFHKQSDQFAYLSMADSLAASGRMLYAAEYPARLSPTANYGAAFLMLPLTSMKADYVFGALSLFYLLLHFSTFYPLGKLLNALGLDDENTNLTLLIYFTSFPILGWKLWPANEGPSLALVSWWLYFVIVRPRLVLFLLPALIAPLFRIHIILYEIGLAIYAAATRQYSLMKPAVVSLGASFATLILFRWLFPYAQQPLGGPLRSGKYWQIVTDIGAATTHLLVPETATQTAFRGSLAPLTILAGELVLALVLIAGVINLRHKNLWRFQAFAFTITAIFTVSLCFSTLIIARFYSGALLWIVATLVVCASALRLTKPLAAAWVGVNAIVLVLFVTTHSTDPDFALLEDTKALSTSAKPYPYVFFDKDLTIHPRQIYAYYRRPSAVYSPDFPEKEFIFLSNKADAPEVAGCVAEKHSSGKTYLWNVKCP